MSLGREYAGVSEEKMVEYQVLGSRMFTELATGTRDYSNFVSSSPRNASKQHARSGITVRCRCRSPRMRPSCPTVTLWSLPRGFECYWHQPQTCLSSRRGACTAGTYSPNPNPNRFCSRRRRKCVPRHVLQHDGMENDVGPWDSIQPIPDGRRPHIDMHRACHRYLNLQHFAPLHGKDDA